MVTHPRKTDYAAWSNFLAHTQNRTDRRTGVSLSKKQEGSYNYTNSWMSQVVTSLGMLNPHGLGVDGNTLFVCEGEHGLKVFDVSNPALPQQIQHLTGFQAYDVIPRNQLLLVVGKDGLYQYDYHDPANLVPLSRIPIESQ